MAAITPVTLTRPTTKRFHLLREATAQANTGQIDYLWTPKAAKFAKVMLTVTADAGTTPTALLAVYEVDPVLQNDTYKLAIGALATAGTTDPYLHVVDLGPGVTGIADDVTLGTGSARASINCILPDLLGIGVTFDRADANETYTYKLSVSFR